MLLKHPCASASFLALALLGFLLPTSASASHICSLSAGTLNISVDGDSLTVVRSGSDINVTSTGDTDDCGATVTNVNTIDIHSNGLQQESIQIDLSGGQFGPGMTAEANGTSEIEWVIDTSLCNCLFGNDVIAFKGGAGNELLRFAGPSFRLPDAPDAVNLNNDNDVDVSFTENDTFIAAFDGGSGLDEVAGITGRDPFPQQMVLSGGVGNDTLAGGSAGDILDGEVGADILFGNNGADTFHESPGTDTANGGGGADNFVGGLAAEGAGSFNGGAGDDYANYGSRSASVSMSSDGSPNDGEAGEGDNIGADVERMRGGLGNDFLFGGVGPDHLDGGPGGDTFGQGNAPDGGDTIIGDSGIDVLDYSDRSEPVSTSLDNAPNDGEQGELDNASGIDTIEGGSADDLLAGGSGVQILRGNDGDDTLMGGLGADELFGDSGDDVADYSDRTEGVAVTLDEVNDDGAPGENDQIAADIESARGGAGPDQLTGDDGSNSLFGGGEADILIGGGSSDRLWGDAGAADLFGSSGNDRFHQGASADGSDQIVGGAGSDLVDYSGRSQAIAVSLDGVANDGEDIENDNVGADVEKVGGGAGPDLFEGDTSNEVFTGRGGADESFGSGGSDEFTGGEGNDTLRGEGGADDLSGGPDDDVLNGGAGTDTCSGGTGTNSLVSC